ncbi:MAG: hypothetical protein JSU00_16110 [Acidobacteria bacterium]|nr:hypothetical protein [Acidobacteriota bacterium]
MVRPCRFLLALCLALAVKGQTVSVQPAESADFPAVVDSNSPAYWFDGQMYVFNSLNTAVRSVRQSPAQYAKSRAVFVQGEDKWRWIESAWAAPDGKIYAWYHTEPQEVCPGLPLTAPEIGEMVSDDGISFTDLGTIVRSGDVPDCATANRYFAGGSGDFTVIPDRNGEYFYILYTNYGGALEGQGVSEARLAVADVADPQGRVFKFYNGDWTEPGLGGRQTPVFPARADWASNSPESFWGPSVHWNTVLQQYVVLLNHVAGDVLWSQEGVYMAFNPDVANPLAWTLPAKLLDGVGWYPQVIGDADGETDSLAGATARLYVMGHSEWRLTFSTTAPVVQAPESSAATAVSRRKLILRPPVELRRHSGV